MNKDYLVIGIAGMITLLLAFIDIIYAIVGAIVMVLVFTNMLFKRKENMCHNYYKANFDNINRRLDELNKIKRVIKGENVIELDIINLKLLASAQHDAWRNLEENKDSRYNIPFDETPLNFQDRNIIRVKATLLKLNELKHGKGD